MKFKSIKSKVIFQAVTCVALAINPVAHSLSIYCLGPVKSSFMGLSRESFIVNTLQPGWLQGMSIIHDFSNTGYHVDNVSKCVPSKSERTPDMVRLKCGYDYMGYSTIITYDSATLNGSATINGEDFTCKVLDLI